ncbi:hypothetical protein M8C21_025593 [Ambrosia artemisiifolia]|uniref:Uncharacterized protein n=1 Tax=Ambrosia artemisiifolia TaxID=4212 RepID=A0AAD5C0Q7_AMBAR|nr:hypothetical protein M8C21_025593 [Ambrosia artemisiifolia]
MDPNSWTRLSTSSSASRRYQSRSAESFHVVEETDGDERRPEYLCPFCAEDFDIVGLCCHIDEEHTVQAKNGRKRRIRRGGLNSFSVLKKELREGNLHSLLGGSSFMGQSSVNTEPDPLLSSFMYNDAVHPSQDQTNPSIAAMSVAESSDKDLLARSEKQPVATLSGEDQEEKARRSEFVQGLLMSSFLNDDL